MKPVFRMIVLLSLVCGGFLVGVDIVSAGVGDIVPCGKDAGSSVSGGLLGDECTLCHLQVLAVRLVNTIIILAVAFTAVLFVNAGYLYITSPASPGNIARAHHIFLDTLVGLIIILCAWLIVNLIMTTFLTNTFGSWRNILCTQTYIGPGPTPITPVAGGATGGATGGGATGGGGGGGGGSPAPVGGGGTVGAGSGPGGTLTEAEAYAALAGNVATNNIAGQPPRTTFDGIQPSTINGVNEMATQSGLDSSQFIITGATDHASTVHTTGTYSHYNGYKVDLRTTVGMTDYIQNNFAPAGYNSSGQPTYSRTMSDGSVATAVNEGDHWDVRFVPPRQ